MNITGGAVWQDLNPKLMTQIHEFEHPFMVTAVPLIGTEPADGVVPFFMYLDHVHTVFRVGFQKIVIIFGGGDRHRCRIVSQIIGNLSRQVVMNPHFSGVRSDFRSGPAQITNSGPVQL